MDFDTVEQLRHALIEFQDVYNATWLTGLLHRHPDASAMDARLQVAELEYVCTSQAGRTVIAENYVGLDPVDRL